MNTTILERYYNQGASAARRAVKLLARRVEKTRKSLTSSLKLATDIPREVQARVEELRAKVAGQLPVPTLADLASVTSRLARLEQRLAAIEKRRARTARAE